MHRLIAVSLAVLLGSAPGFAKPPPAPRVGVVSHYRATADRILDAALNRRGAFDKLVSLCDGIGPRLSGSPGLDRAVAWAAQTLRDEGHERVRTEPVAVPKWVRGRESLALVVPYAAPIGMLGLGGSVGTPPDGITAEVVVAEDEAGLRALGDRAAGRIVLFNKRMPPYDPKTGTHYGETVEYRVRGAALAAGQGAVAALVRSVTARSLATPHTGAMDYGDAPRRIPAAAIVPEAADQIARLARAGRRVVVTLRMEARDAGLAPSANVLAELRGRERPDEIVVMGGHLDSWDVGQGAHDDGAGCAMTMEALTVLRRLGLRPRRTIRVVLWTNEENGLRGAKQYALDHAGELSRHVAAIEADTGGFAPLGYRVDHADPARRKAALFGMEAIAPLLARLGATRMTASFSGADISPLKAAGVPLLGHDVDMSRYFDIHHTHADTVDKVDPVDLQKNAAVLAVTAYVLADMPGRLDDLRPPAP